VTWFRPDLISFDEMVTGVMDLVAAADNERQRSEAGA
jgi:hypothetical protein